MSRIFLSHSSRDEADAVALKKWLTDKGWDDVFLDVDPQRGLVAGERWQDALKRAADRCEAVVFLVTPAWVASKWCLAEFLLAKSLNKRIFGVITKPVGLEQLPVEMTSEWQVCHLVGEGTQTLVRVQHRDRDIEVAFLTEGLARLGRGLTAAGLTADHYPWPPENEPDRIPYRGLRSLDIADAAVFFGRDAQIIRGLDALRGMRANRVERLFAILGGSGSGKSSFMRAGLWPRLARDDRHFHPLPIIRPETRVLTGDQGFAAALVEARQTLGLPPLNRGEIEQALQSGSADWLRGVLSELRDAASSRILDAAEHVIPPTLVLPIDQAEELFNPSGAEEAARFMTLLGNLLGGQSGKSDSTWPDLIIMLTIRSDRYTQLQTVPELVGVRSRLFDDLKPVPGSVYKEIIEGPARVSCAAGRSLHIEPQLTERLIADSSGADALPMLAFTLERLYRKSAADGDLRLGEYEAMGGIARSMEEAIERVLTEAGGERTEQLQRLRDVFIPWLARVDEQGGAPVRQVCDVERLPEPTRPLADRLVKAGLLLRDRREGRTVVEIAHESLLRQWPALRGWLEEEASNLKIAEGLKRDARAWAGERDRSVDALRHAGSLLDEAEALMRLPAYAKNLGNEVADYVQSCRARENQTRNAEIQRLEHEKAMAQRLQEEAQARQQEAEQRRQEAEASAQKQGVLRKRASKFTILAVILGLVAAFYGWRSDRARNEADQATEQAQAARGRAVSAETKSRSLNLAREAERVINAVKQGSTELAYLQSLAALRLHDSDAGLSAVLSGLTSSPHAYRMVRLGFEPTPALAYSPAGDKLALGGNDGVLHLLDAATGRAAAPPMGGHKGAIWSVAFSGDGRRLVASAIDDGGDTLPRPDPADVGELHLWDVRTHRLLRRLRGHLGDVYSVAYSKRSEIIASGGADGSLRVWDPATGSLLWMKDKGDLDGPVVSVAFSHDGRYLASGGEDGIVRLWNAASGRLEREFKGHTAAIQFVEFSPDGRQLASGSDDRSVRLWNLVSGKPPYIELPGHKGSVYGVSFNPDLDSGLLATGGDDGVVRLWHSATGTLAPDGELRGHDKLVFAVAFSPDGTAMASTGAEGSLLLWRPKTPGISLVEFSGHASPVTALAVSPDGRVLASGDAAGQVRLWDALVPDVPTAFQEPLKAWSGATRAVLGLAYCPDAPLLISAAEDGALQLWQADTGAPLGGPLSPPGPAQRNVACGKGGLAVTGGDDGTITIWDLGLRKPVRVIPRPGDLPRDYDYRVMTLALSADGRRIASAGTDGMLRLWNVATGAPLHRPLADYSEQIQTLAFSPNGNRIASGGADGSILFWDSEQQRSKTADYKKPDYVMRLDAETGAGGVTGLAFSPDGRFLLSVGGGSHAMKIWDTREGAQIGADIKGHDGPPALVAFSPTGEFFVSGGEDRKLLLWPGPKRWSDQLCKKLTRNMSRKEWREWVSPEIAYVAQCPGLPISPDAPENIKEKP